MMLRPFKTSLGCTRMRTEPVAQKYGCVSF
uniref:Uncharacterized protein n=1 Tax=Anguilla anguilla TaxID=7936 RepID=A0A0E9QT43_ANGAN